MCPWAETTTSRQVRRTHCHNLKIDLMPGKIYQSVINKERKGDYLGRTVQVMTMMLMMMIRMMMMTVQVVPHITDAIQDWVERVSRVPVADQARVPEVCIIELGGTIGDIEGMPFVEAFRQFQFKVKRENFCNVHVSLVIILFPVSHSTSGLYC